MICSGNKPQTIFLLDHEAAGVLREAEVVLPARHHFQAGFTVQNNSVVSAPSLHIPIFIYNKRTKFKSYDVSSIGAVTSVYPSNGW